MACASCIRGHRSQRCAHHDRPLLKLRRKGRPVSSQCDICRDLRKALGIYTRCICERDVSEAPKRKEMVKKLEVERISARSVARVPNAIATITSASPLPHDSSSSAPFGASDRLADKSSQPMCLNDAGTSAVCTSGSDRCTRPCESPCGSRNGQGNPEQPVNSSPTALSITRRFQTEPHSYNPQLQAIQASFSPYARPSTSSEVSRNIHPQAQAPDSESFFDSETLALWDQFVGDDHSGYEAAGTKSMVDMHDSFQELPTLSTPTNSCPAGACCETCIPDGKCCEMSALCIALGCFSLAVGTERIEDDFTLTGRNAPLAISPISQSSINQVEPEHSQVFSVLDSAHPDALVTGISAQSDVEATSQVFVSAPPCICEENCVCPICDAKGAKDMLSWDFCEFCVACLFCVDSTANLQRTLFPLAS